MGLNEQRRNWMSHTLSLEDIEFIKKELDMAKSNPKKFGAGVPVSPKVYKDYLRYFMGDGVDQAIMRLNINAKTNKS